MWAFGVAIISGAQLNTNLQLEKVRLFGWNGGVLTFNKIVSLPQSKVCKYEKGYNDTVCDNLYEYPDEQVEVKTQN